MADTLEVSTMGKPIHWLSAVNEETRTGICSLCGPVNLKAMGFRDGHQRWRCRTAWEAGNRVRGHRANQKVPRREYAMARKDHCERPECTATIEDPGQLDVHHADGNPLNNDAANLVTLCANCHRLLHQLERKAARSNKSGPLTLF